jgi:hypothetical protein
MHVHHTFSHTIPTATLPAFYPLSKGQPTGYVQVGAEKWLLPDKFMHCAKDIYNFEARSDDVWICTYPRSGTTWTQEMIWLICNDLDYETARKITLHERFPFFE